MEKLICNGIQLEYEERGAGEPVLLIGPVVAGAFVPFLSAPALIDRFRLIRYNKRGWGASTHTPGPVSIADHAADAAALLDRLGIEAAHVAGHSSGGAIAMQLALDRPGLVHSLSLLEPSLLTIPSAASLLEKAAPALDAYGRGDHASAVIGFLSVVSGLDRDACQAVIERHVPGGIAQAVADADTFFGIELPSVGAWSFGAEQAARIRQPVLSVLGSQTGPLWRDIAELLRAWFPQAEELVVQDTGHLLQMQRPEPIARGVAAFLCRHPIPELPGRRLSRTGAEHRSV
ncbi:MAG TPA: alpha/beta hydrolase [Burkholderiaceae bacterium]|nr:alpha/beta hydrolase [Burkholderiaceae bacterium]